MAEDRSKRARPSGQPDPSDQRGSSDESIGRPSPWREGRYERRGKALGDTVVTKGGAAAESHDDLSTPVTQKDYGGSP
jgi:hypothetical protein